MNIPSRTTILNEAKRLIRYGAVGGSTALLELVLFQVFLSLVGLDVAVANVSAVIIATVCNFLANGLVTFKTSTNMVRSAVLYTLLFLFNTTFSTWFISFAVGLGAIALVAKVISMACIVSWNYVLFKKVVFK